MIVVDANFLILLLDPQGAMPHLDRGKERVEFFTQELARTKEEIVIPAPVVAEIVAGRIDRVEEIVALLQRNRSFIVQPFDQIVAIEAGEMIRRALDRMPEANRPAGWKVAMKYDAMIAATAKIWRARAVCTDDDGLGGYLRGTKIEIIKIDELPYPPEDPQRKMDFEDEA
ncbi:MAG: PIN domain-containing protein [Bosea sp.]|uniref:type II toxin-antitoxin system VapC family toxin n=1 Tax=Bosea sp. (in: a-proteobacteria) TaxID=1871050 RepID=UPI001AC77D38|nr:PIN domain-containing protein [Bosea sp. (in: a-proteobacteria)]MBN9454266.1 PIN domain-containing protein [Bosea sp. (in: a-proteobacteria)]